MAELTRTGSSYLKHICSLHLAILSFRLVQNPAYRKTVHVICHACALVFAITAIFTVYRAHLIAGTANFYSVHSWVGLAAVGLMGLQVPHSQHTPRNFSVGVS